MPKTRARTEIMMKAYFLLTVCGPRVILTSYDSINNPELLKRLCAGGFTKFVAHEVSVDSAKAKYGIHFDIVCNDPHESDALRVLDYRAELPANSSALTSWGPQSTTSQNSPGRRALPGETEVLGVWKSFSPY